MEIPTEAIEAAATAVERLEDERSAMEPGGWVVDRETYIEEARVALEAAAPILLAAGRKEVADALAAEFEQRAEAYRAQLGNWGEACDWDVAAQVCEDYAVALIEGGDPDAR